MAPSDIFPYGDEILILVTGLTSIIFELSFYVFELLFANFSDDLSIVLPK